MPNRIQEVTLLAEITEQLNADELAVLRKFARKILNGSKKHGPMDLENDTRDWDREQQDERVDDACYGYMREVQAERRAARLAPRPSTDPIVAGLRELRDSAPELPPPPVFTDGDACHLGDDCPDCIADRSRL